MAVSLARSRVLHETRQLRTCVDSEHKSPSKKPNTATCVAVSCLRVAQDGYATVELRGAVPEVPAETKISGADVAEDERYNSAYGPAPGAQPGYGSGYEGYGGYGSGYAAATELAGRSCPTLGPAKQ